MKPIVDLGGHNMVLGIDARERWWIGDDFLIDTRQPMQLEGVCTDYPFLVRGWAPDDLDEADDDEPGEDGCSLSAEQAETLLQHVPLKVTSTCSETQSLLNVLRKAELAP